MAFPDNSFEILVGQFNISDINSLFFIVGPCVIEKGNSLWK